MDGVGKKKCFICGDEVPKKDSKGLTWVEDYCPKHENQTIPTMCSSTPQYLLQDEEHTIFCHEPPMKLKTRL